MHNALARPRLASQASLLLRHCLSARNFNTSGLLGARTKVPEKIDKDMEALGWSTIFGRPTPPSRSDSTETVQDLMARIDPGPKAPEMHHLHIYSTKHNTHITLTDPKCNPLLSKSSGNIGFRKAARGSYDAAFQLAAFFLSQIQEKGIFANIKSLEVVLRGFGMGREAVTKALLGNEGRAIRPKISQVSDGTRLKFGGSRSRKPRRLG